MNFNYSVKFECRRFSFFSDAFYWIILHEEFTQLSHTRISIFFFFLFKKLHHNKIVIVNSNFLHDSQIVGNYKALDAKCEYMWLLEKEER